MHNMDRREINFITFNQDYTSLAIGTSQGYKLYSVTSVDKLDLIYECKCKDVVIIERLFSSSLLALVSLESPRKLKVCHFKKGTTICNCSYASTILSVKLNRDRLVVCLEDSLYIHNIRDMIIVHNIKETPPNQRGICSLSANNDNCLLAYPGSSTSGEVQLFDANNLQAKLMIPAHDSRLAALNFNGSGQQLATASEKGTVIRVFSTQSGNKLVEFRRGFVRCAHVIGLSFSQDNNFLALSSNTETIHIFRLQEAHPDHKLCTDQNTFDRQEDSSSWMSYFNKAVSVSASYLPSHVTNTLNQSRAFATLTVPNVTQQSERSSFVPVISSGSSGEIVINTVAITTLSGQIRLLLASTDGYLYIYNIPDGPDSVECVLIKQHHLDISFSAFSGSETESDVNNSPKCSGTGYYNSDEDESKNIEPTAVSIIQDSPPPNI